MNRKRFFLALAFGLVLAAFVAPAAHAKPVSSDVANGGYDPWAYGLVYQSTHPNTNLGPLDPWAYALVHKSAAAPVVKNLGPLDPWAYALVHKTAATPVVTTGSSSGFDFSDAGIGAAAAFGVAAILLGTMVVGLRHRRMHRSTLAIS
jgi:hypothetical protein